MEIKTGKSVIDIEIKALGLLKNSISKPFRDAVLTLHQTKGKIVLSGIGKSGHIAKKFHQHFLQLVLLRSLFTLLKQIMVILE